MERMRSNGDCSTGSKSGTMVFWDMQTVPPPPNFGFLDHLLYSHRTLGTGLFSLCPPLKLRAHGIEALPATAHDYIIKSTLLLQQSISCGSEQGSSWKAMIVDMLLWATDHAPGVADMVVISRVLDRSLADAIHQLHIRNYNIIVAPSFPPKNMSSLHEFIPPQITMLHQIFSHSLLNKAKEVAVEEKPLIASTIEEAWVMKTNSQPQQNQMTMVCSLHMENCRTLVEEYLQEGTTEFLECDLYARFKTRFGNKLTVRNFGFEKLDEFLQVSVPSMSFTSLHVGSRSWILCDSPSMDNEARQSMLIAKAKSSNPVQQALSSGPITMEEVKNWLEELVASGRTNAGINLSNLGKDFEERTGKKLNYKSLYCPNLMALLSRFENLVCLERNETTVHIFPRDRRSATPTLPAHVPGNRIFKRPQRNEIPPRPLCSSLPSVVQAPAHVSITRNVPTAMPVPKFSSVPPNITTVRTSTESFVTVPSPAAPFASEVKMAPAAGEHASDGNDFNHLPNPGVAGLAGAVTDKIPEPLKPDFKKRPAPTVRDILAAHKLDPKSLVSKTTSTLPPDLRDASTASEMKVQQAGGKQSLPNADYTAVRTPAIEKGPQAPNGADPGIFSDARNGKKFNYYHFTSTVEEREAIKRTFQSVNRRLHEEFKKRRLVQVQPVDACDRKNNTQ